MTLIEMTDADFAALIAGEAPQRLSLPDGQLETPATLGMLRDLANGIRPSFAPAGWLMVEGGQIVGLCSLVKQPTADGIDIGYGVAAARRREGLASAAIGALLDWARRDGRVQAVRAETSVDNVPSQRVLERNGFVRMGERHDEEDGALICWRADTRVDRSSSS